VALVAVGGLSWLAVRGPSSLAPVATAAAERRDLRLPDGSTVSVGARSRVEVALDARERRVVLDYGEAYFQVAHDAARPFRVVADRYTVEAVGTSFNVRALVGDVRITVTSGIVRVRSPGADVLEVRAGEQYVANTIQRAVHAVDAAAITAWRDGWLRFRDERLDYIVADLSRYAERRIEIADAPTAARRYTGAIRADAIDEWLVALPRALPLDVERPDARTVVLRARAEDAVAP
jgi:transmembrane sensor